MIRAVISLGQSISNNLTRHWTKDPAQALEAACSGRETKQRLQAVAGKGLAEAQKENKSKLI
jgi:hypothetical protein